MKILKNLLKASLFLYSTIIFSQNIDGISDFNKIEIIAKNDTIAFIQNTISEKKKPTIVFIQGSLPISLILKDNKDSWINLPFDYTKFNKQVNLIIINRKGVPLISKYSDYEKLQNNPSKEYLENDNLYYRVFQVEEVLKYLKKQKWVEKEKLFIVGHSEGYRVTAKVAERNPKIQKIACLAADPLNRISENLIRLQQENISSKNDSLRVSKIYKEINDFKNLKNFNTKENDMMNFVSYNENPPINSFQKYKNPVLISYGTNDVRAFNNNLLPLLIGKENLELKIYPDLDHNFTRKEFDNNGNPLEDSYHWDRVFKDVVDWLLNE
jgi:dienelactone hydrolase